MAPKKKSEDDYDDAPAQQPAEDAPVTETTSSDAAHSTYSEVQPDDADERPAPGRQVEQERGTPSEGAGD